MPSLGIARTLEAAPTFNTHASAEWHRLQTPFRWVIKLHRVEIGLQVIQPLPYHAGPAAPRPPAPSGGHCFSDMLSFPPPFGLRLVIRPRNVPPNSSQLSRGYNDAPRGARTA